MMLKLKRINSKTSIHSGDSDIEKVLISDKISFGEKN